MVAVENHIGKITVSDEYLITLIGHTVTGCYGVSGMNISGPKEGLFSFLNNSKQISKGVKLYSENNKLKIDLHITVTFGTNISAIVESIINKVRFAVEEYTGITVSKVNVFVDGMNS